MKLVAFEDSVRARNSHGHGPEGRAALARGAGPEGTLTSMRGQSGSSGVWRGGGREGGSVRGVATAWVVQGPGAHQRLGVLSCVPSVSVGVSLFPAVRSLLRTLPSVGPWLRGLPVPLPSVRQGCHQWSLDVHGVPVTFLLEGVPFWLWGFGGRRTSYKPLSSCLNLTVSRSFFGLIRLSHGASHFLSY